MHVDFKITTWERVNIPPAEEAKILQAIKDGKISSSEDMSNQFDLEPTPLEEYSEQMSLIENDGQSTICVISDEDGAIWENGR